jgi:PAS domain-containing protein
VPALGWTIAASVDDDEAVADVVDLNRRELVIFAISVLLVLAATQLVYRRLARPIERLSTSVRRAMSGEAVGPVPSSGPSEISSLAEDFAAMSASVESAAERYRRLFDANPQPMWVHDRDTGRLLEVNDALVKRFGWKADELLNRGRPRRRRR